MVLWGMVKDDCVLGKGLRCLCSGNVPGDGGLRGGGGNL